VLCEATAAEAVRHHVAIANRGDSIGYGLAYPVCDG
jgi:hypothetical protein